MVKKEDENNSPMFFEEEERPVARVWWRKKGILISCLFSVFWLGFVFHYLMISGWWVSRSELSPAELIGGLGGLCLPMLIVWLVCAYFDRSEQLAYEAKTLRAYLNELVYPTEEGAIYTKTLTDALRTQIREFRTVFKEVNDQTQAVRDDLKHWIQDLSTIINHVDTQTIDSVKEIATHIQTLADATEVANKQAQQASHLFSEQAAILERVTTGTVQATADLSQTLHSNATEMQTVTATMEESNRHADEALIQAADVIKSLERNTSKIEASIEAYESSARQQNARLFGNLEKVLSVFRAHGDMLEQEVAKTANRLGVMESTLKENAAQLFKVADSAARRLEEVGSAFGQKTASLDQALDSFKSESATVVRQIEAANREMISVPLVQAVRTDDLLKEASGILDQLQELSVDMAHLFSPKAEEGLWERYYAGDKAVFMRHIKTELSGGQSRKMKELYKKDTDFRSSVDKYMRAFETMTQAAGKGDDSKLLMSILIGSDAGRLYMVLADVLKGKK